MFDLGVIDHLRLSLTRATKNYAVHAQAAERLAVRTSTIRIGILVVLGLAVAAAIGSLLQPGRVFLIVAVIGSGTAFGGFAAYLAIGFEGRILAHRTCAHGLLVMADRYRALLAEIHDGLLDMTTILARRDELTAQVHALYERSFPPDQNAFETVRQANDETVDGVLPGETQRERANPSRAVADLGSSHSASAK